MKFFLINQCRDHIKNLKKGGGVTVACLFLLVSFLTVNTYAQIRESGMFRIDNPPFSSNNSNDLSTNRDPSTNRDANPLCDPLRLSEVTPEELQNGRKWWFWYLPFNVNGNIRVDGVKLNLNSPCNEEVSPFYLAIGEGVSFDVVAAMLGMGAKVQNRFFEHTALDIHDLNNQEYHPEYQKIRELLRTTLKREVKREELMEMRAYYPPHSCGGFGRLRC